MTEDEVSLKLESIIKQKMGCNLQTLNQNKMQYLNPDNSNDLKYYCDIYLFEFNSSDLNQTSNKKLSDDERKSLFHNYSNSNYRFYICEKLDT